MENKFNISVDYNIFIAKRNIVDYIYKSAKLEGIVVTFPETEAIYNGANIVSLNIDEIVTINNLKHAWQFLFETMQYPKVDFPYVCEMNRKVGANLFYTAGNIRNIPVRIGGTSWIPQIPFKGDIIDNLNNIQNIENATERAITLMLYLTRTQAFADGNKRTAMLCANRIMIENGAGIISIPVEKINDFKGHLIKYYETNEMDDIKNFVYDNCIDGMLMQEKSKEDLEEEIERSKIFANYHLSFINPNDSSAMDELRAEHNKEQEKEENTNKSKGHRK